MRRIFKTKKPRDREEFNKLLKIKQEELNKLLKQIKGKGKQNGNNEH